MKNKSDLFKALFLAGTLLGSSLAYADNDKEQVSIGVPPNCYLPLAVNLAPISNLPDATGTPFGDTNSTVCVDVPVDLTKSKVVFNIDNSVPNGGMDAKGNSNGLKHMVMLGGVIKDRIQKGLIDPEDVSIVGVLHGSAIKWAKLDTDQKFWINQIFALKNAGVNIHLEVCGVTMRSNAWTKANIYSYDASGNPDLSVPGTIYVNQGAIGRIMYLEQQKYVYIHE